MVFILVCVCVGGGGKGSYYFTGKCPPHSGPQSAFHHPKDYRDDTPNTGYPPPRYSAGDARRYVSHGKARLQPRVGVPVLIAMTVEPLPLLDLVILVVPGPNDNRRVGPQPPHLLSGFFLHRCKERGIRWAAPSGEARVVPDQHCRAHRRLPGTARPRTHPAAPDPEHDMTWSCRVDEEACPTRGSAGASSSTGEERWCPV